MNVPAFDLDRPGWRLATAAAAVVLLLLPPVGARVLGTFLVIGVLPGLAVAGSPRFGRDGTMALSFALSPVIFGACMLIALALRVQTDVAAAFAAAMSLFVFVAAARNSPAAGDRRARSAAWIVFAIAAVMALGLPIADTWWRVRSDSWFHAAVADRLARGGLPAMDPYFAGFRLQYLYFYHALLVGCASIARIDHFHAMILVNAAALASCVFSFHALSGLFSRRVGPRLAGLCVWIFALNGWFFLFYPLRIARAFTGETRGAAMLGEFFPWRPEGHDTALRLLSIEGNQFMFLDKFMIGTAFSLTFGLAACALFLFLRARRGAWSPRHDLAFILCVAGAVALHAVTGFTVAIATALVLAALLMLRAQPAAGGPPYARLVLWIALGVAAMLPYVLTAHADSGEGGASIGFGVQSRVAIGLFADILPALVLSLLFLRGWRTDRDHDDTFGARIFSEMSLSATGILVLWTAVVLTVALTVDLVTNNETKFAFLVHLPLSVLAVGGLERLWDDRRARRLLLFAIASATLPLHMLYFHHAVRDASTFEITTGEKAAYAWIRARTPADAVFIDENDTVHVPVLASRDLYWGTEAYAHNWGYDPEEMLVRKRLRDGVYSADGLDEQQWFRLRGLGRPVFMIYRTKPDESPDDSERFLADDRFRGRFTAERTTVFELLPDAGDAE